MGLLPPRCVPLCSDSARAELIVRLPTGFYSDNSIEKFDSPAVSAAVLCPDDRYPHDWLPQNFVMHAKWLAYGRPSNRCECKPCSKTPQLDISARLTLGGAQISEPKDEAPSARSQAARSRSRRSTRARGRAIPHRD